ncbi:hypothetical protein VTP01DRAFT_729 [Rhizomucor pusillus]|uniref:uncharacterized protein n=1 Tax=Rhizomucor pusillus TaxID=4840 RepID=UPI003743191A
MGMSAAMLKEKSQHMSLFDTDVAKSVWNGKLPLALSFVSDETAELKKDEYFAKPILIEAARQSYLPQLTERLRPILKSLLSDPDDNRTIWYEYDNEPLKWHYPIGLLHDLLMYTDENTRRTPLPWRINIRLTNFPTDKLLRSPSVEAAQDAFMSMIKEADFLRYGSTKRVMNLSKKDQSQLWESLTKDSYDDYWDVNKRLINDVNGQTLRNIPLRLYLPEQCPVIQEPVSYTKAGQEDDTRSLGSVLNEILPDVFPPDTHEAQAPASVVIHGISIPLDTPIAWMSQNMSFADNFLHLVICKRSSK